MQLRLTLSQLGATVCLGLVIGLAGCSGQESEVPSINGSGGSPAPDGQQTAAEQHVAADKLVGCLAEDGVNAYTLPMRNTGDDTEYLGVWIKHPEGSGEVSWIPEVGGYGDESEFAAVGLHFDRNQLALWANGEDKTELLQSCVETTGYYFPAPGFDPKEESLEKQRILAVLNGWAQCARDNGLPGLADATAEVDKWITKPTLSVPESTTVETFKAVLEKCPPVDPDNDLSESTSHTDGEGQETRPVLVDTYIEFQGSMNDPRREALQQTLIDAVNKLYEEARK